MTSDTDAILDTGHNPRRTAGILGICRRWCGKWKMSFRMSLTKTGSSLAVVVAFGNGERCFYRTDLSGINELLDKSGISRQEWERMGDERKLDAISPHIAEVVSHEDCGIYAEILCASLNEE